jgi:hypothetical protein
VKKFWFWVKILEIVPAVLPVFVVKAYGVKLVPLKIAAEAVPKFGMTIEPVRSRTWSDATRGVSSWPDVRVKTCRLRTMLPGNSVWGEGRQADPSYFMR